MDSRPKICWSDLAGASVGLWGLGVEGEANLARLETLDVVPVLVDDRPAAGSFHGLPVLATDGGGRGALDRCDVVIKTPGISRYRSDVVELSAHGVAVTGGLNLWLEGADRSKVVCITGTKGKSTTTAITGHLLGRLGVPCVVGGNIGRPPWDPSVTGDAEVWVVETSSFQATDLSSTPPIVAVTSLHPDHLDWHGDAEHYFADKLSLCSQPGADLTIADGTAPLLRRREGLLSPRVRWVEDGGRPAGDWISGLGLLGPHNRRNAQIARAILLALGTEGADDDDRLADAAEGFEPLDSRLRSIGVVEGVEFVDDSLSTNVLPTLRALEAFTTRRVALLVGGFDRGLDYGPLAAGLSGRDLPTLVVTMPDNGPRIGQAVARVAGPRVEVADATDLRSAVAAAFGWARPGGVVLLSPAAPSFGRFRDYRQRAAAFADAMQDQGDAAARSSG